MSALSLQPSWQLQQDSKVYLGNWLKQQIPKRPNSRKTVWEWFNSNAYTFSDLLKFNKKTQLNTLHRASGGLGCDSGAVAAMLTNSRHPSICHWHDSHWTSMHGAYHLNYWPRQGWWQQSTPKCCLVISHYHYIKLSNRQVTVTYELKMPDRISAKQQRTLSTGQKYDAHC